MAVRETVGRITGHDRAYFWFALWLVAGTVLFLAAFVVRVGGFGEHRAFVLSMVGVGVWIVDVAMFFFFWADPQPKHAHRR